jgi:hypothetical protein
VPTVNKVFVCVCVCVCQEILCKYAREQGGIIQAHLTHGEEMHGANHCPELISITEVPHGNHWSFQKKLD